MSEAEAVSLSLPCAVSVEVSVGSLTVSVTTSVDVGVGVRTLSERLSIPVMVARPVGEVVKDTELLSVSDDFCAEMVAEAVIVTVALWVDVGESLSTVRVSSSLREAVCVPNVSVDDSVNVAEVDNVGPSLEGEYESEAVVDSDSVVVTSFDAESLSDEV